MTAISRLAVLFVAVGLIVGRMAVAAGVLDREVTLNISPQPLGSALLEFSKQAGIQIMLAAESAGAQASAGIKGTLPAKMALAQLLKGSGLTYQAKEETVTVVPVAGETAAMQLEEDGTGGIRLAQGGEGSAASRSAAAQQPEEPASESNARLEELEEIVVTAQKRKERLQDVAASISAISREDIERRGLTNMDDYMRGVPGVSRMEIGSGRSNPIVIRGLSLSPETDKAGVGTYFGEVPLVSSLVSGDHYGSSDVTLVDMEQIEILKGPQGTLYGSGSLAGIVRNQPVAPNLTQFEGKVNAGFSATARNGDSNEMANAVLNLPLLQDKLAVRVVGFRYSDSGYIKNVAATTAPGVSSAVDNARAFGATLIDEDDVGRTDREGGRIAMLWQPTESFTTTYTFVRQLVDQTGVPEVHPSLGSYEQAYVQLDETAPRGLGQDTALTIHNLTLGYDFSWGQIMSSSSQIKTKSRLGRDISHNAGFAADNASRTSQKEFAEEIRLTSTLEGPFQFLLGGFYEDSEVDSVNNNRWSGDLSLFPFPDPDGLAVFPFFAELPTHLDLEQKSFFGEASYEFLKDFKATLGARRFDYDRVDTSFFTYAPAFGLDNRGPNGEFSTAETGSVKKAALSYKPSTESLLYGQWSQGFRLGSPPTSAPNAFCDPDGDGRFEIVLPDGRTVLNNPNGLESDRTDNFELGSKLALLAGRARIGVSVYRVNWDKIPITLFDAIGGCAAEFNAGEARSQGVELEAAFRVISGLEMQLGLSYMNAELTEDVPSLAASSGDRLPGSPRFTANAAVSYDFPLHSHNAYARADMLYVGEYYNNLQQAGPVAGGYYQLNLRSGITVGAVSLDLYANNVTGADELTWIYTTISTDGRGFRLRPRTIGAELTWAF